MKRFLILVGVAVVAAAMYVAASPASQRSTGPTAKQFSALKKQVASLTKTEKSVKKLATAEAILLNACMKIAVPIDQFGNPQPAAGTTPEGYLYRTGPSSPTSDTLTTGLDAADPTADPTAPWFTAGDGTCGTALGENPLRHAAAKAGIRLPHALLLHSSFTAHRP